jgi:hypothetical protein
MTSYLNPMRGMMIPVRIPTPLGDDFGSIVKLLPVGADGIVDARPPWTKNAPTSVVDSETVESCGEDERHMTLVRELADSWAERDKLQKKNDGLEKTLAERVKDNSKYREQLEKANASISTYRRILDRMLNIFNDVGNRTREVQKMMQEI